MKGKTTDSSNLLCISFFICAILSFISHVYSAPTIYAKLCVWGWDLRGYKKVTKLISTPRRFQTSLMALSPHLAFPLLQKKFNTPLSLYHIRTPCWVVLPQQSLKLEPDSELLCSSFTTHLFLLEYYAYQWKSNSEKTLVSLLWVSFPTRAHFLDLRLSVSVFTSPSFSKSHVRLV